MTTWMFVALLWFEGEASWPDTIWSFTYHDKKTYEQKALDSAKEWSRRPKVTHVFVSECFRWVHYSSKEV